MKRTAVRKPVPTRPRQRKLSNAPGLPALISAHRQFVDEVLADPSKPMYQVYMRLYPKAQNQKVAANRVSKILARPEVQDYMAGAQDRIAEKAQKTQDEVAAELVNLGFSRITDVISWDADGNITVNPSEKLSEEEIAAIAKIKCTEVVLRKNSEETVIERRTEVQLHDKLEALKLFIKMIGVRPGQEPRLLSGVLFKQPGESDEETIERHLRLAQQAHSAS